MFIQSIKSNNIDCIMKKIEVILEHSAKRKVTKKEYEWLANNHVRLALHESSRKNSLYLGLLIQSKNAALEENKGLLEVLIQHYNSHALVHLLGGRRG